MGNETAANDAAAATRPKFPGKWNRSPNYRIAWHGGGLQPAYILINTFTLYYTTRPQNIPRLKLRSREVHYNVIRFSNCFNTIKADELYIKACTLKSRNSFYLFTFFFLFCFALLISRAERRRSLKRLALCWNKTKKVRFCQVENGG